MLTGSDSAPAKANEAKQKNDIGAARDQVYLFASNAQTEAYETVYVKGKKTDNSGEDVTAGRAGAEVSNYVKAQISEEYKDTKKKKVGLASIVATNNGATITISTTDFIEIGTISETGGTLTWSGVTSNVETTSTTQTSTKTLSSIAITTEPTKTSYNVGETLNLAGIVVTATYSDNTTSLVTATYSPENGTTLNTAGETTITASYTDGGVTKTATTSVTVIEDTGGDPTASNSVRSLAQAGTIHVDDRVNYNPGTATSASLNLPTVVGIDGTISATAATDWHVIKVNQETGEVSISPLNSGAYLTINFNADNSSSIIDALNMVAEIYKNNEYAKNARSAKIEDFDIWDSNCETPSLTYNNNKLVCPGSYIWITCSAWPSGSWLANVAYDAEQSSDALLSVGDQDIICVHASETNCLFPIITLKSGIQMTKDGDVWQLARGDT